MRKLTATITLALSALALPLAGCPEEKGPMEKTGEKVDEAADEAKDSVEEAADEAKEAAEEAGDSVEEAADEVEDSVD